MPMRVAARVGAMSVSVRQRPTRDTFPAKSSALWIAFDQDRLDVRAHIDRALLRAWWGECDGSRQAWNVGLAPTSKFIHPHSAVGRWGA